ncbi:MAG: 50S ribosomal protein L19e [Candidatus Micrarchaeota archaeon]
MSLEMVRRIASRVFKAGESRVRIIDAKKAAEALTADDVRNLAKQGVITVIPVKSVGRGKARKRQAQKLKGRRAGMGRRKGTPNAVLTRKKRWVRRVRGQRKLLAKLKHSLAPGAYQTLYRRIKGGLYRSKRQLELQVEENKPKVENK